MRPGVIMEKDCFLLDKELNPVAGAEIGELKYFSLVDHLHEPGQAPGAGMILEWLKQDGLIAS